MTTSSLAPGQSEVAGRRASAGEDERGVANVRKKKITISLSEKSLRALDELRDATDADTDSEVFRNALRLHLTLIRARAEGVQLFMKRDGKEEMVPVTLFADVDGE
jgi:Arc/MetJ-type ribon-helix-helix transcriptional regulator